LRTFTAALSADSTALAALTSYARLFNRALRSTYAAQERAVRTNNEVTKAERKAALVSSFQMTSRQANAVLMEADSKRSSIIELYATYIDDAKDALRKRKRQLKDAQTLLAQHKDGKKLRLSPSYVAKLRQRVFRCQTKIAQLDARIASLKDNLKNGVTHLTFGTKKLLRQRHAEGEALTGKALSRWRHQWDSSRNDQFLVLGSKDETAGCLGCVAIADADGSFCLRVRLPDALGGGYVSVPGVRFEYGAEHLRHALAQQDVRAAAKRSALAKAHKLDAAKPQESEANGKKKALRLSQKEIAGGQAITWRFMRESNGSWRVSFTTETWAPTQRTHRLLGAVGVDLNAGFVTVAETDCSGNILTSCKIVIPEVGRTAGQRAAARGEAVKEVIQLCQRTSKPLVLEELDFSRKKRELQGRNPQSRRKLSALGYRALQQLFHARARDAGVEVIHVNPAYTSTQGQVRYATRRGWTIHMAAAGVIAGRGQEYSEKAPVCGTQVVSVAGAAVEWAIPEEVARSNASQRWPLLHKELQRTIASYYRDRRAAGRPSKLKLARSGSAVVAGGTPAPNRGLPATALI
jgi:IS605 OrfB family transposase